MDDILAELRSEADAKPYNQIDPLTNQELRMLQNMLGQAFTTLSIMGADFPETLKTLNMKVYSSVRVA